MNPDRFIWLSALVSSAFRPIPTESVSQWCCNHLRFREPKNHGPFSVFGREYIAEPIDSVNVPGVSDIVLVFGSQTGKTGGLMGAVGWMICNDPSRVLWVMPNIDLARTFAETRWQPMLDESPETSAMIPRGASRHAFKKTQQSLGGSVINFFGSNSPANLASTPANVVILDEVDKFDTGRSVKKGRSSSKNEADAVNLAEQRTKSFPNPKRIKTSTPTVATGLIWVEFLKGDQRRYFVPCPHCGKEIVLAWSADFRNLNPTGVESYVKWDGVKDEKGKWNLDEVERTAHVECCHCKGRIVDAHKTVMVRSGKWKPTAHGAPGYRSYHLSSLYASSVETNFGRVAVKFLLAKNAIKDDGLNSLQGVINGDLAEPWVDELGVVDDFGFLDERRAPYKFGEVWPEEKIRFLAADRQAKGGEHYWYVVRAFGLFGKSRLIAYGRCNSKLELVEVAKSYNVLSANCIVDTGYLASDTYSFCVANNWKAMKGDDGDGYLVFDKVIKKPVKRIWDVVKVDPHLGKVATAKRMNLYRMANSPTNDKLLCFLKGLEGEWTIPEETPQEYLKQITAEVRLEKRDSNGHVTNYWKQVRDDNHLRDCERMIIVAAIVTKFINAREENHDGTSDNQRTSVEVEA